MANIHFALAMPHGGWWRWALVSPDGVTSSRMVGVSASVNLPLHHKVQKFSSGTVSPWWSQKKGRKTWCGGVVCLMQNVINLLLLLLLIQLLLLLLLLLLRHVLLALAVRRPWCAFYCSEWLLMFLLSDVNSGMMTCSSACVCVGSVVSLYSWAKKLAACKWRPWIGDWQSTINSGILMQLLWGKLTSSINQT